MENYGNAIIMNILSVMKKSKRGERVHFNQPIEMGFRQ
jgi:hypothetical protein